MGANTALGLRIADSDLDVADPPTPPGEPAFVAADELDRLSTLMIPDAIAQRPTELAHTEAEALFAEGLRGATGRSLLAKDIAASRAHLRYFGALLDVEIERLGRNSGDVKKAKLYSDLVDKQHRRMTTSAELFMRLDAVPAATFRIDADQAAFVIGDAVKRTDGGG